MSVNSPSQGWPASRTAAIHRPASYFMTSVAGWSAGSTLSMAVSTGSPGKETRFQPGLRATSYALARESPRSPPLSVTSLPADVGRRELEDVWSPTARVIERGRTLPSSPARLIGHVHAVQRDGGEFHPPVAVELGLHTTIVVSVGVERVAGTGSTASTFRRRRPPPPLRNHVPNRRPCSPYPHRTSTR